MLNPDRRTALQPAVEERRFRHLVETYAQALWEANRAGELVSSSGWPALTGQPEGSSEGRAWLDAVHPDDKAGVEAAWNAALAGGAIFDREFRVRRRGSGWVWTLAHAAPMLDNDGTPLKWLGINVDISARKNAEHALREADRQKDEFISILAHELRNPLAPLRSGIDLLLNETATSTAKAHALAIMSRQTSHLARLIEDLIDASRIATGKLQVHREKVRLADVLRASVENIQPALDAKRQQVAVHGLDEIDPVLEGDPVRLNQAFVNVLNNSAKFSPERSRIDIAVRRMDAMVSVTVSDCGRAIPPSDLPNIFKLFVQSARHDRGDGLGIGLALANDVVKLHGGTIEARSGRHGIGAQFEVRLPVVAFSGAQIDDEKTPLPSMAWKSLRMLIADDNSDAAEALGALLELAGHTIRIVHDGQQAVEEAASFLPEVIFMDIGMPVMGGLEATRNIRACKHKVRPFIVALTGWSSEADRAATRDAGCDMHLTKPADVSVVLAAVGSATAIQ